MPPIIPSASTPLAAAPGPHAVYPWRFRRGDYVHARGHYTPLLVCGGELWTGFPHYHLLDSAGKTWRIPQLHCSSKAPGAKK